MTENRSSPNRPADALRRAVAEIGSQAATARLLGVTQQAVSTWLKNGKSLPPEHVIAVEAEVLAATGISRHDLRPDIYPRESATPAAANPDLGSMAPAR